MGNLGKIFKGGFDLPSGGKKSSPVPAPKKIKPGLGVAGKNKKAARQGRGLATSRPLRAAKVKEKSLGA